MAYYKLGRWLVLVLLGSFYFVQCSGRRAMKKRQMLEPDVNQTNDSEEEFIEWVNFVGSLNHSIFKAAAGENKMFASQTIIVDKDPSAGDFTSIQDAIDSLPPINLLRVVINVNAGTYTEKVEIPSSKAFIAIQGEGADNTIVEWGDTAATLGPNGKPLGTKRSATFAANSPYFIARNITFKNTTPVPEPGAVGKQAVAFRISGDTAAFLGCKFLGGQDTLFDHLGRHFYKDCYIEGSVDFIFGSALSLFEGCHVHAVAGKIGAVTAQGRSNATQDSGFSFVNCKVTGSGALYLGRAWGPFSRVVFAYTYMDDIILPKGWYDWGDPLRQLMVDLCLDSTEGSPRTFLEHQANTNQIYVLLAHSWVQTESFWKKGVIDIESYIRACSHSHTVEKEQGHWSVKVGANKDNMFYGRIKSSIGQLVQNTFYGCKKLRY